jgi:hypothetical protein
MGGACGTVVGAVLVERPKRKRPLEKRRNEWEDYIAMDLQDVEREAID